jgi:outer membrane protein, heavy metal efflux system
VSRAPLVMKLGLGTLLLTTASACVSESAGYRDVQKLVSARTGHEARWQYVDGEPSNDQLRALLAEPLSLEAAVELALLNSPELQAGFEELGIARAQLVSALRLPNPVAEGSVRFRKQGETSLDFAFTEDLSQLLLLPLRNQAAKAELDTAKLVVAARALDLAFNVKVAFYAYLADQQILEFRESVMKALEASATAAKALHDAGNITDLSLESEQVLAEEARVNYASAQTTLQASRERLNVLFGLTGDTSWRSAMRLVDPPPDLPLSNLEARALEQSLDLGIIRQRFQAAAKRVTLAQAEGWLPELKGGVIAEREEDSWSYGPLAEVQVPLFYQGQGEVARARAEMRRQHQLLSGRSAQVRSAARAIAAKLVSARDRALRIKNVILPARERILSETLLHYNAMSASVFQLLMAKRDQVESARGYVEALRDYWVARAEVEQLRAGRLPGAPVFETSQSSSDRAGGHRVH